MIKCIGIEPTKKIILVWSDMENLLIPLISKSTNNDTNFEVWTKLQYNIILDSHMIY